MSQSGARLLFWSPRILSLAFAIFLSLFALDVFNETHGFVGTLTGLSIHLIPVVAVLAILAAAWRWEWVGAAVFSVTALWYVWKVIPAHLDWAVTIAAPLLAIAALFLANWMQRSKLRAAL